MTMSKPGIAYYFSHAILAIFLLCSHTLSSQDVLHHEDFCDKALQLNLESEMLRSTDRRLALSKAEQALALAKEHACSRMEALAYRNVGIIYYFTGSYGEAEEHFRRSLFIYESMKDLAGVSSAYNNLGLLFIRRADFDKAADFLNKSHDMSEAIGDLAGVSRALINITQIYFYQGKFADALASSQKALSISEELNDLEDIIHCQINIAAIYETQRLFDQALEMLDRLLQSANDLDNDPFRSRILHNMGTVYYELDDYNKALELYTSSLLLKIELNDKAGTSLCLSNMGSALRSLGHLDESNSYFLQALKIDQELGNQLGIANQLAQIAGNLLDKKEPLSSIDYYNQSNEIAFGINARTLLRDNYMHLVKAHLAVNNYDQAYDYMYKYITFRDDMMISPEELEDYRQESGTRGKLLAIIKNMGGLSAFELALAFSIVINMVLLLLGLKRR